MDEKKRAAKTRKWLKKRNVRGDLKRLWKHLDRFPIWRNIRSLRLQHPVPLKDNFAVQLLSLLLLLREETMEEYTKSWILLIKHLSLSFHSFCLSVELFLLIYLQEQLCSLCLSLLFSCDNRVYRHRLSQWGLKEWKQVLNYSKGGWCRCCFLPSCVCGLKKRERKSEQDSYKIPFSFLLSPSIQTALLFMLAKNGMEFARRSTRRKRVK